MDGGGGLMTELLLTSEQIGQLVAQFFIAGAGTLSFAVLFASPKRTLPYCGLVGAMGWFIYELAVLFGLSITHRPCGGICIDDDAYGISLCQKSM